MTSRFNFIVTIKEITLQNFKIEISADAPLTYFRMMKSKKYAEIILMMKDFIMKIMKNWNKNSKDSKKRT